MRFAWLTLATGLGAFAAEPANIGDLKRAFENPPDDARVMMRWWWFGPAVNKNELEREMRAMKDGGIGGFEVQPVYPLELEGNSRWVAPDFLDALRFVGEKARELGLRMDLTLGSGWPYGGPHIDIAQGAGKLRVDRVQIPAGAHTIPVPKISFGEKLIAAFMGTPHRLL